MSDSNDFDFVIIHSYGVEQAIADGILFEFAKHRWPELSGGKPIVLSAGVYHDLSAAAHIEVWNEYVTWVKNVRDTLPEEDQMFETTMNGKKIWVLEDGAAFTILYPEER
jgi:hypothetical protein